MSKGFSDIKPHVGNNEVKIDEMVDILHLVSKKWITVRFVPGLLTQCTHWIPIISSKKKKKISIPKNCLGFNIETEEHDEDSCPYCKVGLSYSVAYYANAIVRSIQEDEPVKKSPPSKKEKESGFKEKDSDTWTPFKVVRLPSSLAQKLQGLKDLNVHKVNGEKVKFDITHPKYGADVNIKYDEDLSGTDMYQVQLSSKTALTEEEEEYLKWNLNASLIHVESYKEAVNNLKRLDITDKDGNPIDLPLDELEDDAEPKKRSKKQAVEDEDDIDDESNIYLDDEDEKPKSKKKPAKSLDEDDDLDLDDEEEKPKSKKKPAPKDEDDDFDLDNEEEKPKSKKKPAPKDEDDDFDLDDEEEKPKSKKKPAKSLDEDDDLDLDDEEEKPKSKKKPAPKDEDDDLDLDDEEEKPKSKKKPAKSLDEDDDLDLDDEEEKPKSKKKPAPKDEDDDFDLDDDEEEKPKPKKKPAKSLDDEDDVEEEKPVAKKPSASTEQEKPRRGRPPTKK